MTQMSPSVPTVETSSTSGTGGTTVASVGPSCVGSAWNLSPYLWLVCINKLEEVIIYLVEVMLSECCDMLTFCLFTEKLITGTREALCVPGSPVQSQSPPAGGGGGSSGMGSRRGSISSLSSVTSMLEDKDDEKIRCCHHCMDTLLKIQHKLEEKDHVPDIVKLYEVGPSNYLVDGKNHYIFKNLSLPLLPLVSFDVFFSSCLEFTLLYPSRHSVFVFVISCCSLAQNFSSCQRLRMCMEKVDERAPEYIKMAESLK